MLFAAANQAGFVVSHFFMQQESVCMAASSGLSLSVDSVKVSVRASGIELPWKRLCFLGFPEGCCGIEPLPGKLSFSSPSHVGLSRHGTARSLAAGLGRLIERLGQESASARWKLQSFVT